MILLIMTIIIICMHGCCCITMGICVVQESAISSSQLAMCVSPNVQHDQHPCLYNMTCLMCKAGLRALPALAAC